MSSKYTVISGFSRFVLLALAALGIAVALPREVFAQGSSASIYVSPTQGTFEIGNTFDISFFVNTAGKEVNAVKLDIKFPPDKMQVVNPSTGKSFISLWVDYPQFSNKDGTATLQGGLPSPGINTSAGLITTITFRAKTPGDATIQVLNSSKVLANDGNGTNILGSVDEGKYTLTIPVSQGPIISSSTHNDPNKWYRDNNVNLSWRLPETVLGATSDLSAGYSWSFDKDPLGVPDNEVDGPNTTASFEDVESGIWYFHVKAKVADTWTQASHFVVKIDNVPPAAFTPSIEPDTYVPGVILSAIFLTTDRHSGVDHYEVNLENLSNSDSNTSFAVEATSPWEIGELEPGDYRLTIKAYDGAGNSSEGQLSFTISNQVFSAFTQTSIALGSMLVPLWLVALCPLLTILFLVIVILWRRRRRVGDNRNTYVLSGPKVDTQTIKDLTDAALDPSSILGPGSAPPSV